MKKIFTSVDIGSDTVKILENTTLYAHWEVTDIVKNAVENTDAFFNNLAIKNKEVNVEEDFE